MKITNVDQNQLLLDLDAQRKAMNLSYQNVADACEVSQATIIRVFKNQSEPTFDLLQKIAAAVHYDAKPAPVMLEGYTKEEYISYLKELIERREDDYKIREAKAEARHNMVINQKTRTIRYLTVAVVFLALGFVAWLIMDILHPTMGWFNRQMQAAAPLATVLSNFCSKIV
jgi:transcriptional regulator with XRE-family HTH domain